MEESTIAFFNMKEIRAIAPFEVGRETDRGVVRATATLGVLEELNVWIDRRNEAFYPEDLIPFPTEKELEKRLKDVPYEMLSPACGIVNEWVLKYNTDHSGVYSIFYADTLLEALTQLFMWVEHGLEWKGGKWTK